MNIDRGLALLSQKSQLLLPEEFVSVIVPFRNESDKILISLNSLTAQVYPKEKFEVIFVDDASTDDSYEKLMKAQKPRNFRVISVPEVSQDRAFKKKAVNYGIENSRGELIVTTDADCIHDKNWLSRLLSEYDPQTGFISGPVSFIPGENIFSKIQALEFAGIILSGAGLIGYGNPTICNGANLTFRKSVFNSLNGYKGQMHLSSGEDELLMQRISEETNYTVKFCFDKASVVLTNSNKNIIDFFQQRKRWSSKGLFYKNKLLIGRLILIILFYLSIIAQVFLFIFLAKLFLVSLSLCLVSKFIIEYKIISKGIDLLFDRDLRKYFIITEVFQLFYLPAAGISGIIGNFKWKGRKLKR